MDFDDTKAFEKKYRTYKELRKMIKILFVCHGNICRSTMAESVMTHLVHQRHLEHQFQIASAATSREEIGNGPHYGTVDKLRAVGIPDSASCHTDDQTGLRQVRLSDRHG